MINKKGSSAVFLCVIAASIMSISLAFVYAAHSQAVDSYARGAASLGGDSVISEFDDYVLREYGLFLLQGNDSSLSAKFRNYLSYSLDVLNDAEIAECSVSAGRYNVSGLEDIQTQINTYMKTVGIADKLGDQDRKSNEMDSHTLRHGPTIVSLPSRQIPEQNLITKAENAISNIKDPEQIIKRSADKYLINEYIMGIFNNDSEARSEEHFFRNEVEYILSGKHSDEANVKKTDLALRAIRFPTNLAHIYSDPEKIEAIAAAAEIITPGLLGTVTQAGIASVWAAAESVNDVRLLHAGYKVPVVKDGASWALDLDGLLNKDTDKLFKPEVNKGRLYDDYLRILLFIEDDNIKTARILDLIQINMRKNHDSAFLIEECCTGISIETEINDRSHRFDKTYQQQTY